MKKLTSFRLNNNNIGNYKYEDNAAKLAFILLDMTKLVTLNIYETNIRFNGLFLITQSLPLTTYIIINNENYNNMIVMNYNSANYLRNEDVWDMMMGMPPFRFPPDPDDYFSDI